MKNLLFFAKLKSVVRTLIEPFPTKVIQPFLFTVTNPNVKEIWLCKSLNLEISKF